MTPDAGARLRPVAVGGSRNDGETAAMCVDDDVSAGPRIWRNLCRMDWTGRGRFTNRPYGGTSSACVKAAIPGYGRFVKRRRGRIACVDADVSAGPRIWRNMCRMGWTGRGRFTNRPYGCDRPRASSP